MSLEITKKGNNHYQVEGMTSKDKTRTKEFEKVLQNPDCQIPIEERTEEQKKACRGSAKSKSLQFKKDTSQEYGAAIEKADQEYEKQYG